MTLGCMHAVHDMTLSCERGRGSGWDQEQQCLKFCTDTWMTWQGEGLGPGAELGRDAERRREAAAGHGAPAVPQPRLRHPRRVHVRGVRLIPEPLRIPRTRPRCDVHCTSAQPMKHRSAM